MEQTKYAAFRVFFMGDKDVITPQTDTLGDLEIILLTSMMSLDDLLVAMLQYLPGFKRQQL